MASPYNKTHIEYDGHLFNETLLNQYNYTLYENGTLSNSSSRCYLVFGKFNVHFLPNGTTINGTSCATAVQKMDTRGGLGIGFGVIFAILIVLGITCLNKHGRSHLPPEKRFRLVSRRWPWYWYIVTGTCGCISGFVSVDVDRDYLQGTALILQNVFYYVGLPAMLASIWEMTRHWGSFCERQLVDDDAWKFPQDDFRSKIEFYLPLVFYLFSFLTFFLSVLRSWTKIPQGTWSLDHSAAIAVATDGRFKASSIFGLLAWIIILVSVFVSVKYYQPVSRRVPWKIALCLAGIFVRVVYNIAVAWEYDIGPLKPFTPVGYIYALGYGPIVLCMIVMVLWGRLDMNDDLKIKQLRRERDRKTDYELGIGQGRKGQPLTPLSTDDSVLRNKLPA